MDAHRPLTVTRRDPVFSEPECALPEGERGVYQLAGPFQLDAATIGVALNIRRVEAGAYDVEIGSDLAIIDDPQLRRARRMVPLNRSRVARHPTTGEPHLMLAYPVSGGFVPLGALTAGGAPHPHAGTGFGFSHITGLACDESGVIAGSGVLDRSEAPGLAMIELMQFSWDGAEFRIAERELLDYGQLAAGWEFVSSPLCDCIPDGEGLLGCLVARPAGDKGGGRGGVARWRREGGRWRMVSFVPVTPAGSYEPSVARLADGSLLLTVRGCHEYRCPDDPEAMADAPYMDDLRLWRSSDGGSSWELWLQEPKVRACTTVSVGVTPGGLPFVVGNPWRQSDSMGRTIGVDGHSDWMRETMCLWPVDLDAKRLLPPVAVRDAAKDFGPAPYGTQWHNDHPLNSLMRLADGRWHALLCYRLLEWAEAAGNKPPTEWTGTFLEEVSGGGNILEPWKF